MHVDANEHRELDEMTVEPTVDTTEKNELAKDSNVVNETKIEVPVDKEESKPSSDAAKPETGENVKDDEKKDAESTAENNASTNTTSASAPVPVAPSPNQARDPVPSTPGKEQPQMPMPPPGYFFPPYPYHYASPYPPMPPPRQTGKPATNAAMTAAANPHKYTDVSSMSDPVPDMGRNRGGVSEIFPQKLQRMLEQVEREGLSEIVSFFSHGRAFAIHKPRRFVAEIMPKFFRQTRLTSFQRQLNLYGFKRISQGPDNGGYYHELFLKGRPGLCVNMKRTRVKGNAKTKRDPDAEPNFYTFPPIPTAEAQEGQPPPPTHTAEAPSDSTTSAASPTRPPAVPPVSSPPASMFPVPVYAYPPPQYHPMAGAGPYSAAQGQFQHPVAPYTAAQQKSGSAGASPVHSYPPPFYAYPPYYPPPPMAPGGVPVPPEVKAAESPAKNATPNKVKEDKGSENEAPAPSKNGEENSTSEDAASKAERVCVSV